MAVTSSLFFVVVIIANQLAQETRTDSNCKYKIDDKCNSSSHTCGIENEQVDTRTKRKSHIPDSGHIYTVQRRLKNCMNDRKPYKSLDFSSWFSYIMLWNIIICIAYSNTNNRHILCIRNTFDFIVAICWQQIKTTATDRASATISN